STSACPECPMVVMPELPLSFARCAAAANNSSCRHRVISAAEGYSSPYRALECSSSDTQSQPPCSAHLQGVSETSSKERVPQGENLLVNRLAHRKSRTRPR